MTIKSGTPLRRLVPISMFVALVAAAGMSMAASSAVQSNASSQALLPGPGESSSLAGPYQRWLDEDVRWIITPRERAAFLFLQTNAERLRFIQQFWQVRNPEAGSSENRFKQEHYRRLAFANVHFAAGRPGWISDRGHIYIVYGPPDSIDAHPSAGNSDGRPSQVWHYRVLRTQMQKEGVESPQNLQGSAMHDVDLKFVDTCNCGDYKLTSSIP